ncbi:aminoacyl-tRNA hydrolase [candidate division WWE3 bacterium]|nr:aminoacyl-tRNA hydrolase [candidate division WWE3 bacterium]
MKLIAGLGNPGDKYQYTRHNVGFLILNAYVSKKVGDGVVWLDETKFRSQVYYLGDTILLKPQTFMNKVGSAVAEVLRYYRVSLEDLLVIHDDVDLEFLEVRLKKGSGAAGHHGVVDLISKLGTDDFRRLRVGVGRPEDKRFDVEDYVLKKFSAEDLSRLKEVFEEKIVGMIDNFVDIVKA